MEPGISGKNCVPKRILVFYRILRMETEIELLEYYQ